MIELNEKHKKKCDQLVDELCANYDHGSCLMLERGGEICECPQKCSYHLVCKYFTKSVLPVDKELEAELMPEVNKNTLGWSRCTRCGDKFQLRSNRQKYCPICAITIRRRKEAQRLYDSRHKQTD